MPVPVPVVPIEGDRIDYQNGRNPALVLPDGQVRVVRSIINTRRQLAFGDYVWNDEGVAEGPVWARVDLKRQTLSVFRAGHEIGTTVILFGANSNPTPSGVFPVLAKAQKHRSSLYDAEMPFMMRLTNDGVAIHASAVQEGSATHGCIGVPLEFARLLFGQMQVGDEVAIFAA
nr:L,D-transpeptidase family protein [Polymorphobacter multimanifer]